MNLGEPIMNEWNINIVDDTEFRQCPSGIYCLIYWQLQTSNVRIDLMSDKHEPIQSFVGSAENVRKHTMRFLAEHVPDVSLEHAAYIGSQLQLADVLRIDYKQDE